jgi:hypothetical protein
VRRTAILALTGAIAAAGCGGADDRPRRNARSFDGAVERYGTLTLLWVRGHEGRFADRTRDCLL